MKTAAGVFVAMVSWVFVIDAYRRRPPDSQGLSWLRGTTDPNQWTWWVPALMALGFFMMAVGEIVGGHWWALIILLPAVAMARAAVLRRRGRPVG